MTEPEARDVLRHWPGLGGLEAWIAVQRRQATSGGWVVRRELEGWRFRLELVAKGVREHKKGRTIRGAPSFE